MYTFGNEENFKNNENAPFISACLRQNEVDPKMPVRGDILSHRLMLVGLLDKSKPIVEEQKAKYDAFRHEVSIAEEETWFYFIYVVCSALTMSSLILGAVLSMNVVKSRGTGSAVKSDECVVNLSSDMIFSTSVMMVVSTIVQLLVLLSNLTFMCFSIAKYSNKSKNRDASGRFLDEIIKIELFLSRESLDGIYNEEMCRIKYEGLLGLVGTTM
jgi:hypothetical protein